MKNRHFVCEIFYLFQGEGFSFYSQKQMKYNHKRDFVLQTERWMVI
jgi:hypothetical protein